MKSKGMKNYIESYLFLLPAAIIMIIFLYNPLITSISYSFYQFKNFVPSKFVGIQNYKYLFKDNVFWNSVYLTFKWVIMNAFIPTFAGLILAILLEFFTQKQHLTGATRTILFMPMMMSTVAVGLLWALIYDPNLGIINGFLRLLGYTGKFVAYGNPKTALYMAFIPVLWQTSGFSMVVFSAALQGISRDLIEAAKIDGANKVRQVIFIMIPSILRTITMLIIVNMISGFKAFDLIYVLTRGGPGMSTEITSVYSYKQAFFAFKFEYASTMMVFLLVCVVLFLTVFNLVSKKIENRYGS